MKPDWKDAPEWANYLALDVVDGRWFWFEEEPLERGDWWAALNGTRCMLAGSSSRVPLLERRQKE